MMRILSIWTILMLLASMALTGCSISYSVGKSSDGISASFDSISASSTSGGDEEPAPAATAFSEDISAATVLYVSRQENSEQFLQTVSNIARSHGIVDWEQEAATFSAMGIGLKRAGVAEERIATFPYFRTLVGTADYDLILTGYHQS